MIFSKQEISKFKGEGKYYIVEGNDIRRTLKKFRNTFYISNNVDKNEELNLRFPDKTVECCNFNVVWGDYKIGIKYTEQDDVYYIFLGGNCFYELPEMIAVGKEIDGDIYLICERFPTNKRYIKFMVVSINDENLETKYQHVVFVPPYKCGNVVKEIKTEDVICFAKAFKAIKVFNNLANYSQRKNKKSTN